MATFYVGQRVRIVGCRFPSNQHLIGCETRISAKGIFVEGAWMTELLPFGRPTGWEVSEDYLEPILPEGHKASEYTYTELMDRLRSGVVA